MAAPRIAVVGGGLAGLAAAIELAGYGWEVDLFERGRLLGGRATSFELDGIEVDNGQHVYLACCTEFIRFVERVGMANALYVQERFDVIVYGEGKRSRLCATRLPAPWHLVTSLLFYKHLNAAGKIQLVRALLALMRRSPGGSESFGQWLRAHGQGAEAVRSFWEPFMVPALNASLETMSAADAAFVISTAFLTDRDAARFGYSLVPLARIMDAAAARLHAVHRSKSIVALDANNAGVELRTIRDERFPFDAVVLAISPRALLQLLGEPSRYGLQSLDSYVASAVMDVHLWHDRGRLDFDFAALLNSPVQWVFQKAEGYLCCSLSAADVLVSDPTAEVVNRVWDEVRSALPELARAQLARGAATRNPEGTYSPKPGVVRPGPRTAYGAVAIAGSWTATGWPDTMESAVRSGRAAAKSLMEQNAWIRH